MSLKRKDLLSLASLSVDEIRLILQTADSFKEVTGREIKKVPALRGRTVVNLFFEPSTRTRTSFELAAKRLSADVINFSPSSSSVVKGETVLDTARNIEAMQADIIGRTAEDALRGGLVAAKGIVGRPLDRSSTRNRSVPLSVCRSSRLTRQATCPRAWPNRRSRAEGTTSSVTGMVLRE